MSYAACYNLSIDTDYVLHNPQTSIFAEAPRKQNLFVNKLEETATKADWITENKDRYRAIVKPLELQSSDAVLKTCGKASCVWIISMLLAVPEAVFSDLYLFFSPDKNTTFEACAPYPVSEKILQEIHSLMCFSVFYIIPLTVISVYYFLIARTLFRSTFNMPAEEQAHARKQVVTNDFMRVSGSRKSAVPCPVPCLNHTEAGMRRGFLGPAAAATSRGGRSQQPQPVGQGKKRQPQPVPLPEKELRQPQPGPAPLLLYSLQDLLQAVYALRMHSLAC
ncbi:bombesin receptor subtype-3 [Rhinatrema bivittatum]|uniref:bombesin receptor subtype-3 n=1 Tax=Rhinatrema bivittatum TaxID=194408 RepID=UPI001129E51D|nr:bombesin receptor subtype-3 [Rhinatrema bivittatum]